MTRFVVVAGTDTGVGKTFVAATLARGLRGAGLRVVAIKPLESGCSETVSEDEDGAILARATGQSSPRAALLRLRAPLTPALAAAREGVSIDLDGLVTRVRDAGLGSDLALVEGAGGIASPLTWDHDLLFVAGALEASVLIVGADRLGVLNHVRLAVHYAEAAGVPVVGIVLSTPSVDASTGSNADALARSLRGPGDVGRRVVTLPHGSAAFDEEALTRLSLWIGVSAL